MTDKNKQLVSAALGDLFGRRDLSAADRYFAEEYQQHNPMVAHGRDGLRTFVEHAVVPNPNFSASSSHTLADGDLVAVRSRYTGFGPRAFVGFDIFRIEADTIVEHWDCLQEDAHDADAPFHAQAPRATAGDRAASREVAHKFVQEVLVERAFSRAADFLALPEGSQFAREASENESSRRYQRAHRIVADGELALVQSEGSLEGRPHAFYDLFRVSGGKIVEHWGVAQEVPAKTASGLGMF